MNIFKRIYYWWKVKWREYEEWLDDYPPEEKNWFKF